MTDVKVFQDCGYHRIPLRTWMKAADQRATVAGMYHDDLDAWKVHMRSLVPVPWFYRSRIEVATVLHRGGHVVPHAHPEWTLIYYAHISHVVSILEVEGKPLKVYADEAVLVPPNVEHSVPRVEQDLRFSIAFRVYAHDNWVDIAATRTRQP